ncbi:MAG: DUF4258 domain-containing protein [Candidatus Bipolaricaulota bacterium]|nr:DUF4258 domain-containing protein [Candidatus Bipolaricaulota bacterium]
MDYHLTEHARDALKKRQIRLEWLEQALIAPERTEKDSMDETLEHRLARIEEFGGRTLRVVVDARLTPPRVVTAYFDRRRRDR